MSARDVAGYLDSDVVLKKNVQRLVDHGELVHAIIPVCLHLRVQELTEDARHLRDADRVDEAGVVEDERNQLQLLAAQEHEYYAKEEGGLVLELLEQLELAFHSPDPRSSTIPCLQKAQAPDDVATAYWRDYGAQSAFIGCRIVMVDMIPAGLVSQMIVHGSKMDGGIQGWQTGAVLSITEQHWTCRILVRVMTGEDGQPMVGIVGTGVVDDDETSAAPEGRACMFDV